jgi:hypothetical protein
MQNLHCAKSSDEIL